MTGRSRSVAGERWSVNRTSACCWECQASLDCSGDVCNARWALDDTPGDIDAWRNGTGEEQRSRLTESVHEPSQKRFVLAAHNTLVEDDQAHRAALGIAGRVGERLFKIAGGERIVAELTQRSAQEGAGPLVGHYDEHSRRNHHRMLDVPTPPFYGLTLEEVKERSVT
jgi:hypothetical protein